MKSIHSIPEVKALDQFDRMVRIPEQQEVPLTPRVQRLIDQPQFRRLARISQLGLVPLVYPGATHSRFEHSLGVYRMALCYLRQLGRQERFAALVSPEHAQSFIVASLLHDIGHWPFCHPIEDLQLSAIPDHEAFADEIIRRSEIANLLDRDWDTDADQITALLNNRGPSSAEQILHSMLCGPIDIDKMDYLYRDSLHAGVPYGRHFDRQRLIGGLCVNRDGDAIALTEKGRTAAELMVFARYVMFSEVYWHHAVRSATAMFQRAFYLLRDQLDLAQLFLLTEQPMIQLMMQTGEGQPAGELLDGLFGPVRQLYKRLAEFSCFENQQLYRQIARQPYERLVAGSWKLSEEISRRLGKPVAAHEVLIDAPPVGLEVEFLVQIHSARNDRFSPLTDVSPVVKTLAATQFDDYVKRVRVLIHPRLRTSAAALVDVQQLLARAMETAQS